MPVSRAWIAEITRKLLHLASATIPLVYWLADWSRETMLLALGACLAFAGIVEVARFGSPAFAAFFRHTVGFMVRDREWRRVSGATYVLLAALLCVAFFPRDIAVAVLLILSIADSAASLVGLRFGRGDLLGKSWAGSLAFFLTALVILLWLSPLEIRVGPAFLAAVVATIVEALPTLRAGPIELSDNLTVPLITGALLVLIA